MQLSPHHSKFCFEVAKNRETSFQTGEELDKTFELYYDVSGQGSHEFTLQVWRLSMDARESIHREQGTTDGYFEADFLPGFNFYICFKSLDSNEKELSFMTKQVTKN